MKYDTLRNELPGCDIRRPKKDGAEYWDYCLKENTKEPGTEFQYGEKPVKKKRKAVLTGADLEREISKEEMAKWPIHQIV